MIGAYQKSGGQNFGDGTAAPVQEAPAESAVTNEADVAGGAIADDTASAPVAAAEQPAPTPSAPSPAPVAPAAGTSVRWETNKGNSQIGKVVGPSATPGQTIVQMQNGGKTSILNNKLQNAPASPEPVAPAAAPAGQVVNFKGQQYQVVGPDPTNPSFKTQLKGKDGKIISDWTTDIFAKTNKSIKLSSNRKWIRVA